MTTPTPPAPPSSPFGLGNRPPGPKPAGPRFVDTNLQLTEDIYLTSNTASDDRWKIGFGYVTAHPHEYLIHMRSGKILRKSTGQGTRCFKWPGDTVILVPTSLKQLFFEASQLTLDNIHIRIRGFAIYRISNPEKTFERISFWNRPEGEKKLALMIGEPCRSHTKWLVSNMTLEDSIRKRKEAIADILLAELKTMINDENFGVSIETIDIQDVRFSNEALFEAYQGPSKEIIFKNQQLAELVREQDVETAQLKRDQEMSERRKEKQLRELANQAQVHQAEETNRQLLLQEQRKTEREKLEHNGLLAAIRDAQEREKRQRDSALNQEVLQVELAMERQRAELQLELLKERNAIDGDMSPVALEKMFLEKSLPVLADAITASMQNSRVTIYQGANGSGGNLPFSVVLNEIMNILQTRVAQLEGSEKKGEEE